MIKKRLMSVLCALSVLVSMFSAIFINVDASQKEEFVKVDGSYLTNYESSSDTTRDLTRGEHLMDGDCSITKAGVGRIYVYASTTANHTVDYVSTVIYVDQYNENTKAWDQIDFWQVEDTDTYFVSTSKYIMVDRGYYYRVHADHVAGMRNQQPYDEANTATDGIFIN